jgi:hypothetical protein
MARDRELGGRIERMMRNDELMSAEGGDALSDDSAVVRASEEGLEWEVLTGPPAAAIRDLSAAPAPRPDAAGGGHAGTTVS